MAAQVLQAARTEISSDGKALVVHRFDVDENGQPFRGMEDFCSLLGLRPAAYTKRSDVHISLVYGMITVVYAGYQQNPAGPWIHGRKTWAPGKALPKFIAAVFGTSMKAQVEIVEAIREAVSETAPVVREAMKYYDDFEDIGVRMLLAQNEEIARLREPRVYSLSEWKGGAAFRGLGDPPKLRAQRSVIGRSEGLAPWSKKRKSKPKAGG